MFQDRFHRSAMIFVNRANWLTRWKKERKIIILNNYSKVVEIWEGDNWKVRVSYWKLTHWNTGVWWWHFRSRFSHFPPFYIHSCVSQATAMMLHSMGTIHCFAPMHTAFLMAPSLLKTLQQSITTWPTPRYGSTMQGWRPRKSLTRIIPY